MAVFGVLYCLFSLLILATWRCVNPLQKRVSPSSFARLLFWVRISPVIVSAVVTLAYVFPAFLLLEGPADEDLGTLLFGICSLLLLGAGVLRVVTTRSRTRGLVSTWISDGSALDCKTTIPTLQADAAAPPLLVYGVRSPVILVSEAAVSLLNRDELRVSVQHEVEHTRCHDNLKKLIVHSCPFPGMGSLDRAWQEASELSADQAAVSTHREALDLAAALIKLSQLAPLQLPPAFTTGLVNSATPVSLRVERLLDWSGPECRRSQLRLWYLLPATLVMATYAITDYTRALSFTHHLTEWFIR
jgi:Zn-dependent protease with chaperone function